MIGDTQLPFEHQDYFDFCNAVYKWFRCNEVVHIGDWWDFHALSHYKPFSKGMSAEDERNKALEHSQKWYRRFPNVRICNANHDQRPNRLAESAGLPDWFRASVNTLFGAPEGWKWRDVHTIDGVYYEHGHELFPGMGPSWKTSCKLAIEKRGVSTVFGHLHSSWGVIGTTNRGGTFFGCATGCGVDPKAYAFNYSKNADNTQLGCAVVRHGVPMPVRMKTDRRGRWTREL